MFCNLRAVAFGRAAYIFIQPSLLYFSERTFGMELSLIVEVETCVNIRVNDIHSEVV